jgi:penicillin-binding protein 1A
LKHNLSKDQIFELYINQIFLGQRAYGFAAAAHIYFGKPLTELTLAEAAMLAGLPKAPSAYNPVVNPKRARIRQQYVLHRMRELGYISDEQHQAALEQALIIRRDVNGTPIHAEFATEMARQIAAERFPDDVYTRGLRVYTTIVKDDQDGRPRQLAPRRSGLRPPARLPGCRGPT